MAATVHALLLYDAATMFEEDDVDNFAFGKPHGN